jgi:protein-tyrosine phosphatase
MNFDKIIRLEGAPNFRDIGGYSAKSGKKVKIGMIYRSDELSRLTDNDVSILEHLGIKMIFDLRTPSECKSKPDRIIKNSVRTINIPMNPLQENFSQKKLFVLMHQKAGEFDFDNLMDEYYQKFAFGCKEQIKEIITLLSNPKNLPALIHCTAGKDRTGFISAIIQLLAGVPRNEVLEDYLATNQFIQNRVKKLTRFLRIMSLFRISESRLKPLLEVNEKYLVRVLDNIYSKYANIEEYLINACKVEDAIVLNLRNMLVE